jgi:hypothetical protein
MTALLLPAARCRDLLVGLILFFAATLKALTLPPVSGLAPDVLWLGTLAEATFAVWLWVGMYARATRVLSAVLFAGFLGMASYRHYGGAADCGCFGALQARPVYTAVLDAGVVVSFLTLRCSNLVRASLRRWLAFGIATIASITSLGVLPVVLPPEPGFEEIRQWKTIT